MKLIYTLIILTTLLVGACNSGSNKTSQKPKAIANGKQYVGDSLGNGVQYTYKNSILISEIPMKEQNVDGLAKEFYDNGKIHFERNYSNGMREGVSIEYYDTGEKYAEIPYSKNKINGVQYRYKKDGTIVFEVPYKNGIPVPGIKEYDAEGKLVEQPIINFKKKGNALEMLLSNKNTTAEFYQVLNDEMLKVPAEKGVGKLILGSAKKGSLTIRAVYKTDFRNKAAVDAKY